MKLGFALPAPNSTYNKMTLECSVHVLITIVQIPALHLILSPRHHRLSSLLFGIDTAVGPGMYSASLGTKTSTQLKALSCGWSTRWCIAARWLWY